MASRRRFGAGRCPLLRLALIYAAATIAAALPRPGGALAQDDEPFEAREVVIEDELDGVLPVDQSTSVEVIELDEATAGATLSEILDEVAGVRVRRLGGLEAYSTVSIRGSTAAQVLVLRDGVPVNGAASAEVDLGELDLSGVERIEVYRGPSPAHFGTGGIGGVINLVSREEIGRRGGRLDVGLGAFMPGSFDFSRIMSSPARRQVAAQGWGSTGRLSIFGSANLWNTVGDFTYLDDNGTLWEEGDDRFARRENNDATQSNVRLRAAVDLPRHFRLTIDEQVDVRTRGVAGYGADVSTNARLRMNQSLSQIQLDREGMGGGWPRLVLGLSLRTRRDEWIDREGEIGVGRAHQDDSTFDVASFGRAGWTLPITLGSLWIQAEIRHQRFRSRSLLGERSTWSWSRTSGGVGAWVTWGLANGMIELTPQGRIEVSRSSPGEDGVPDIAGGTLVVGSTDSMLSDQFGVTVNPWSWLRLRASIGQTSRQPTFLELFGNRGTVVGNPELRPESGLVVDGGLELNSSNRGFLERARLDVTGFYRAVDDLIQLIPNTQNTFVAGNVGSATVAGIEASGALKLDWGSSTGSRFPGWILLRSGFTFMDALDRSERVHLNGKQLPLRPRWEVFSRIELGWGPLLVAYELDYTSGNYLDPYNSFPVPHRLFHSAELVVDLRRWRGPTLTLLARNLTDQIAETVPVQGLGERRRPVVDVAGFPLPGLTIFLTMRWELGDRN